MTDHANSHEAGQSEEAPRSAEEIIPNADRAPARGEGAAWVPGNDQTGVRPVSPAAAAVAGEAPADAPAEPDDDVQATGSRIPQPASAEPSPKTGADASNHGSR